MDSTIMGPTSIVPLNRTGRIRHSFFDFRRPPACVNVESQKKNMRISQESPDQPEVIALIADLDAYQDTLYPAEARYALDLASLKKSNVIFLVARNGEGLAVGCGSVVITGSVGELKRVYVRPESRSQGVARSVLLELEVLSLRARCDELFLETGPYSHEALAFYHKLGYKKCGPFGAYPDHPLSVFMVKHLVHQETEA
jgi:putative acetyltransferase